MLISCKQSKFLDLNPGVSLCRAGSLKCIICLSQKEMLYPRKLLRHNSRELPIFTNQTAALSVKGGLGGRKKGAPTRMEKPGIPMSPLLFKRFWLD